MKKLTVLILALGGLVCMAEARPSRGNPPGGRAPRPPQHHRPAPPPRPHYNPPPKPPRVGWGFNFSPYGASLTLGTRIGHCGGISYTIPLFDTTPTHTRETVVVREPTIIQQPIVVQTPAQEKASSGSSGTRTWVEGYWLEKRDGNGALVSRTWVEGHWE